MGYTHYWNLKKVPKDIEKQYLNVLLDLQVINRNLPPYSTTAGGAFKNYPIVLRDGGGEGSPEFSNECISFNGDGKLGLHHESFYFDKDQIDFRFCKTNRKPYDFVVCLALLSIKNHIEGFEFSSDGTFEDWKPAIQFYENTIGKLNPSIIEKLRQVEVD